MTFTAEEVMTKFLPPGKTSMDLVKGLADRLPTGAYQPGRNPHGVYRCKNEDRWCAIAVFTDDEWLRFCKVIKIPALAGDPRFATLSARKEHEDELDKLIGEWTIYRSAEEVMAKMQAFGVAAGVVMSNEDQLENDPQSKARDIYPEIDHPRFGKHHPISSPFVLSKAPCEIKRAPLLGEHNEYVLKDILGYSDDEIAELAISGALE